MKSLKTQAVVLRRTNYGEADRILQLITPDGRYSAIARGVRKEKSRLAGGIELFAVCDVVLGQGKGDMQILTSARLVQFYRHILEDYDRMQFGYEALKQVARASEMVDEPEWFEVIKEVLIGLDVKSIDIRLVETWFYLRHSALLGHELSLWRDIEGEPLSAEATYRYDVSERGLRQVENGELTADHIKLLRLMNVKSLQVLAQIGGADAVLMQCFETARAHAAL